MKKRMLACVLALAMALSLLTGCAGSSGKQETSTSAAEETTAAEKTTAAEETTTAAEESGTVIFTDSVGREVEVDAKIEKVAVSGPLANIVLYAFAPELMVGFSSAWSEDIQEYISEEYLSLPVLGQLYGGKGEMNLEELLKADPQVVIDIGEPKDSIVEDLNQLQEQIGIPFVHITCTTKTTGDMFRMLGKLLGMEERAEEYALYSEKVYARAKKIANSVEKVNLLYITGDEGHNVIAANSYHSEVIDLLSNNLAQVDEPSSKGTGNEVEMEQILLWNPDVIIFAPNSVYGSVEGDPTWEQITAIQNGAYYEVPYGPYNWMGFPPSIQRYLGMMWMAELLYPEAADYDLKEEVVKYYEMFYHVELTDEQYDKLVANSIGKQK